MLERSAACFKALGIVQQRLEVDHRGNGYADSLLARTGISEGPSDQMRPIAAITPEITTLKPDKSQQCHRLRFGVDSFATPLPRATRA
jgi:hypothetical protein